MILFILIAVLLSMLAAAFLVLPLLRPREASPSAPRSAVLVTLILLLAGGGLYAWLGNFAAISNPRDSLSNQTISLLARHLEHEPADLSGWLELGQAYSAIGNYSLALRCFERANRLAATASVPASARAQALAGMAEAMLMSADTAQLPKAAELLERALLLDPHSPKALFYSAVIAYQQGRLELARERFATMLSMNPPETVRVALQRQIEDIDQKLRHPAADAAPASAGIDAATVSLDAATAIHLHVTLSPALAARVPPDASLFVFVRAPAGGPPLAVKRSAVRLPQDVDLSAADSMVAGRSVQPGQAVSVVARISATGSPLPQSGDLYGEIRYVAGKSGAQALQIDKLNP